MDKNTNQPEIVDILKSIDLSLKIIANAAMKGARERLEKEHLTTDTRKAMYELFDGNHTNDEISKAVKTSSEAVRQLAEALYADGLIEYVEEGRSKKPKGLIRL